MHRNTMASLIDDEDRPFYIKKIWCHGQSILPPIIGIASLSHALHESDCVSRIWMGLVAPLILFAWPYVSWKAIVDATSTTVPAINRSSLVQIQSEMVPKSSRKHSRRILLWGGVLILVVYISILTSTIGKCGANDNKRNLTGTKLLLLIFSALAAIETVAFLAIMATCLPNARR